MNEALNRGVIQFIIIVIVIIIFYIVIGGIGSNIRKDRTRDSGSNPGPKRLFCL